jgi:hypothetical protein
MTLKGLPSHYYLRAACACGTHRFHNKAIAKISLHKDPCRSFRPVVRLRHARGYLSGAVSAGSRMDGHRTST